MADISLFVLATIPVMVLLGARHALDVDHIAAIDNLVRLRNAAKSARWLGSLFSTGHMLAVCAEMVVLIYVVKSLEAQASFQLLGGILGALMLAFIGGLNLYSLKHYGRSGFGILAQRMAGSTRFAGNVGSPVLIGFGFGLGFDTATQISALTVTAVASASQGVQVALILAAFFAAGMIPTDTLDSLVLREVFSRMTNSGGFKAMSYALSVLALSLALLEATGVMTGIDFIPSWSGAFMAVSVISAGFSYSYYRRDRNTSEPNQASLDAHKSS
jgi:high-affinity nickel-transport protein